MPTYSPFEDPPWLQGMPSPYYTESHHRFQRACRQFIDEKLNAHAIEWEREGTVPPEVWHSFAEANMLIPNLAAPLPVKWLRRLGLTTMPGGLQAQDFDDMHSYIYFDEVCSTTPCYRRHSPIVAPDTDCIRWLVPGYWQYLGH